MTNRVIYQWERTDLEDFSCVNHYIYFHNRYKTTIKTLIILVVCGIFIYVYYKVMIVDCLNKMVTDYYSIWT